MVLRWESRCLATSSHLCTLTKLCFVSNDFISHQRYLFPVERFELHSSTHRGSMRRDNLSIQTNLFFFYCFFLFNCQFFDLLFPRSYFIEIRQWRQRNLIPDWFLNILSESKLRVGYELRNLTVWSLNVESQNKSNLNPTTKITSQRTSLNI